MFTFDGTAANVSLARTAVAELGERLGMLSPVLDDLKTIVTEACAHVLDHVDSEPSRCFEVEAFPVQRELAIVVRGFGAETPNRIGRRSDASVKIGLDLISGLSSKFDIATNDARGGETVVRMRIAMTSRTED